MTTDQGQLQRQREWHGWSFRDYTAAQKTAIRQYIETGETSEDLPNTVHPSKRRA